MIVIDTSALIDALCGPQRSLNRLIAFAESDELLGIPAVVLYEWLRGLDLAIAATAIMRDAALWTLNRDDFADIRGLRLA